MMFELEKLESIEIIPEKKIFKINGEDFGRGCTNFEFHVSKNGLSDYCVSIDLYGKKTFFFDSKTGEKKTAPNN